MYKNNFLNSLSKYLIIIIASLVSIVCFIVLAIYIYISTFHQFSYVDKLGYFSKVISWYYSLDIKIYNIEIEKNNKIDSYKISIINFEKYSNYNLEIKIPSLSFNCNILACLKDFGEASNILMLEPEFNIKPDSDFSHLNNNIHEVYLQTLSNIDSFVIKNGIINLNYQNDKYKFSEINFEKEDKKNLNILGNLKYRKNLSKSFTNLNYVIKKNKDKILVDLEFESLNIGNLKAYYENFVPIGFNETIIDGKLQLSFVKNKINNLNFAFNSDIGETTLRENFFQNFDFKKKYEFKELNIRGKYNFIKKSLKINFLNFSYKNHLQEWSYLSLIVNGNLLEKDSNFRVEINFNDLIPYSFLKNNYEKYEDILYLKFSGKSLLEIKDNQLVKLELHVDPIRELDLSFKNIFYMKNFDLDINKLSFKVEGNLDILVKNLARYDIAKIDNDLNVNGFVQSNVDVIFSKSWDFNNLEYYLKGSVQNIEIDNYNESLLYNEYKIANIKFNINKIRDKEILNIKNLDFILINNVGEEASIFYSGQVKSSKDSIDLKGNFRFKDFLITSLYNNFDRDFLKLVTEKISGRGKIQIDNSKFNKLDLIINDFSNDILSVQNMHIKRNNIKNVYELNLDLNMNINNLFQLSDIYKQEFLNIINTSQMNNFVNAKVNITVSPKFELINTIVLGNINNIIVNDDFTIFEQSNIDMISNIKFKLVNAKDKFSIKGNAEAFRTIINFNFLNHNNKKHFYVNFELTNKQLEFFNSINKYIDGKSVLKVKFYEEEDNWNFDADMNFYNSKISIPSISYNKNNFEYSNLNLLGVLDNEFLLNDLIFYFKDMKNKVSGKVNFDNYEEFIDIYIENFIYDNNNFAAEIRYNYDGNINVSIDSGALNLDTFLNSKSKDNTNFDITAKLDNLILFDEFYLQNASLDYKYENNSLSYFDIYGNYYGKEIFKLKCLKKEGNNLINEYFLSASDAGKFFQSLNYNTEINGGYFSSEGYFGNLDNDNNIMGTVSIDNFRIMKAPIFAELLLAASLTGLLDVLNNDGIEFEQFDAQYFGKDDVYTVTKSRAYGLSLGITGEGWVNKNNKSLNIKGSLIPAYKINSFFNDIPIIGEIISGKEDEGLFAINYMARGNWQKLEMEINPLSVLTPGLLRNVFDFLD